MGNQQMLDAFEQMWGTFPEPVLLVRKDRTILATNELARTAGYSDGTKCFSRNPEALTHVCKSCKASVALRAHHPVCTEETQNGQQIIAYWVPLKDDPDVYVHFGIGTAALMGIQPYPIIREVKINVVNLSAVSNSPSSKVSK